MKAQYVERGQGRIAVHNFLVLETEHPVPHERTEETFFAGTAFRVSELPKPKVVSSS